MGDGPFSEQSELITRCPRLQAVLISERLFARVLKENAMEIRTFLVKMPEHLRRSNHDPSRGQTWSSREQPVKIQESDTDLWREIEHKAVGSVSSTGRRGGRWESEVWAKLPLFDVTAVIHTAHELHEFNDYYVGKQRYFEILSQYAQINAQSTLRELELGFNHRRRLRRSPFLDLSLDPIVGLPQLSNLERLERFVVSGLVHRMGKDEMAWISKTWPRLISLEVPVIHHWKDINEAVSTCRMFFSGEVSELQRWCPGRLKVVTPIDCYCCGRCESIYCECRNISQDQWAGNVQWEKSYSNDDDYVLQE
ncbi:hypothetical protein BG000_001352 [Podila horticola]|nr:hypothetical protein BG000_001352 [Podila horticola]